MLRDEQKLQAADSYIQARIEEGLGRTGDTFPAFIEGIEWADEHPRKGLVDIDKACEWLKNNFRISSFDNTKIITNFSSMSDLIDSFNKIV